MDLRDIRARDGTIAVARYAVIKLIQKRNADLANKVKQAKRLYHHAEDLSYEYAIPKIKKADALLSEVAQNLR